MTIMMMRKRKRNRKKRNDEILKFKKRGGEGEDKIGKRRGVI